MSAGRLARLAVERVDGHVAPAVAAVRRLDHVVLEIGSEAVLRAEERRQRDVGIVAQAVGGVLEAGVHRRRIAHQADAPRRQSAGGRRVSRRSIPGVTI